VVVISSIGQLGHDLIAFCIFVLCTLVVNEPGKNLPAYTYDEKSDHMKRLLRRIREIRLINASVRLVLKSLSRFFGLAFDQMKMRWPVYGLVDCEFKGSSFKLYNHGDDGLVYYFYYDVKYYEEADLQLFSVLSEASKCAIDIGANTGLYSIVSSKANPQLKVYAFEPYPANSKRLQTNIDANLLSNIEVRREALGSMEGQLKIVVPKNCSISTVASVDPEFGKKVHPEQEWRTITVPVTTLDRFRQYLEMPIDLIKCDVEAFEMSVFEGAGETLEKDRPAIIFESFLDEERRIFFNEILDKFNYYLYLILDRGIVYIDSGFPDENQGLNFLITPVKPTTNFISFNQLDLLRTSILQRPNW
jgi:FkbM family methyltransferase